MLGISLHGGVTMFFNQHYIASWRLLHRAPTMTMDLRLHDSQSRISVMPILEKRYLVCQLAMVQGGRRNMRLSLLRSTLLGVCLKPTISYNAVFRSTFCRPQYSRTALTRTRLRAL